MPTRSVAESSVDDGDPVGIIANDDASRAMHTMVMIDFLERCLRYPLNIRFEPPRATDDTSLIGAI